MSTCLLVTIKAEVSKHALNVVNRQTLVNAQKDPEKYRGLIVRIAGYSAYFTELSKDLQDDLIARTQHEQV